jgi:hypothetical protein
MKQLICPISDEKIPEHLPRVTASLNLFLLAAFAWNPQSWILFFLTYDFLVRGFGSPKLSLVHHAARGISAGLKLRSKPIDKAPKLFAARLGGLLLVLALLLNLSGLVTAPVVIVWMIAALSSLECIFGFCVGCSVYQYLVLPFYQK